MAATHHDINRIINACASKVDGSRLDSISQTARQFQMLGLSAQAIAHLVGCVPTSPLLRK